MSNLTKHPQSTLRLWLRLGRLLTLTGVISLLALWGLLGCTTQPDDEVVVVVPTPAPATPQPTSPPSPTPTAPVTPTTTPIPAHLHPKEWAGSSGFTGFYDRFTFMIELKVYNEGEFSSPPSKVYVFDGMVEQGGELLGQVDVPQIPVGDSYPLSIPWDVTGSAGSWHQMFYYICLVDVAPSPRDCEAVGREVKIASLTSGIYVSDERERLPGSRGGYISRYDRGDQVPVTVWAANLEATVTQALTITTEVDSSANRGVLGQEAVQLAPGQLFSQTYFYDTTGTDRRSVRLAYQIDGDALVREEMSIAIPADAYFAVEPVTGTAPLTVTLIDLSTLRSWTESWEWDFGDGITSTQPSPSHTYTSPGSYTITLTIAVLGEGLPQFIRLIQEGTLTDSRVLDQTYPFTHTEQIEVQ